MTTCMLGIVFLLLAMVTVGFAAEAFQRRLRRRARRARSKFISEHKQG